MAETLTDDELMSILRHSLRDPEYARVERALNSRKESVKTEAAVALSQELARKDAENTELRSMCDVIGAELASTLQMLVTCEEAIGKADDKSKEPRVSTVEYERMKKELEEEWKAGKIKEERISFLEKENMSIKSAYIDLEDSNIATREEIKAWQTKYAELEAIVHCLQEENSLLKFKEGKNDEALGHDYGANADANNTPLVCKEEPNLGGKVSTPRKLVKKWVSAENVHISDSDEITDVIGSDSKDNILLCHTSTNPSLENNAIGKKSDVLHMVPPSVGYDCVEDPLIFPTPKRRRVSRLVISDSESEDEEDQITNSILYKSLTEGAEGNTPPCYEPQGEVSEKTSERSVAPNCVSYQDDNLCPRRTRRRLRYPTTVDFEEVDACRGEVTEDSASEHEDESLDSFIVDDSELESQSSSRDNSNENLNRDKFHGDSDEEEEGDSTWALDKVLAKMRKETKPSSWEYEADMLSAFAADPKLCMQAVCALYRMQTMEEQSIKASFSYNQRGFSKSDALRGSKIAQFLLDYDSRGPIKKSVRDLEKYDAKGVEFCRKLAIKYSKQLFNTYQKREDPYFRT